MHPKNSGSFEGTGRHRSLAIIGIGCRFPGGVNDVESFWELLSEGRSGIIEAPANRWDIGRYYDPDPSVPGMVISKWGGFVDNIDKFDARFWGLSPREAMRMDPQQRWLLEVAWEAIEDSGTAPQRIRGSRTGVFVGIASNDYAWLQMPYHEESDVYTNSGNTASIASNRISYLLDLKGPSSSVDTACSSALVAVWAACQSIWSGNCEAALAGGVNALIVPHASIGFSRASMLSPTGQCYAFDSRANGYVRAEGAGIIYIKPLETAIADGDRIYATIRAAVCNQDGHTSSMTVPGVDGQSTMLRSAYEQAGVSPARVAYMEAHGTGTPVGDPIEATALGRVLKEGRPHGNKCLIGSVKSNIGHLEAGSGLPGLIKAALVLNKDLVPPICNFEEPNPNIPFDALGLQVADRLQPLPHFDDQPAIAGVNSFGFGGTNAHVVLEAASTRVEPKRVAFQRANRPKLLPISARDETALRNYVQSFRDLLGDASIHLADFCYSAGARKEHHSQRLVVLGHDSTEMQSSLDAWLREPKASDKLLGGKGRTNPAPLVFVFTGQGAQWWGMGRQLMEREPLFRQTIEQIDSHFRPLAGWSLITEMLRDEAESRIDHTNVAQPAIFALQVAVAELWKSWGIEPAKVIGHSVGEVAAAYVAGIYSLEDAVKIIFHRSRLQNSTGGHGRMLAVGVSAAEARQWIGSRGDRVQIAVFNSPQLVTLAGDTEPLEQIYAQLKGAGKFAKWLRINYAFHTHQMEPIKDELLEVLAEIKPQASRIPYLSTVTGGLLAGERLDAMYWWRNVRQPVLFGPAISNLAKSNELTFLEIGPHPALGGSLKEYQSAHGRAGGVFHSLRRNSDDSSEMLRNLAELHFAGQSIDWQAVNQSSGNWIRLPKYPWTRETYWLESKDAAHDRMGSIDHPLLGLRIPAPQPTWRFKLHPKRYAYLDDHRFWESIVFPGAGYGEIGLALSRLLFPEELHVVEDLDIKKAMFITSEKPPTVQVVFEPGEKVFSVYSRLGDKDDWDLHAQGLLSRAWPTPTAKVDLDEIRRTLHDHFDHDRYYAEFAAAGYQFGPNFQQLQNVWRKQGEALAEIVVPDAIVETVGQYHFHPAVLDACFHIFKGVQVIPHDAVPEDYFYLPHSIRRIRLYCQKPPTRLWAHAHLTHDDGKSLISDIRVYGDQGEHIADIFGFRADHVEQKRSSDDVNNCYYQFQWRPRRLRGRGIEQAYPFASVDAIKKAVDREVTRVRLQTEFAKYEAEFLPAIERLAGQFTVNAWLTMGWKPAAGQRFQFDDIARDLKIVAAHHRLARAHLESFENQGIIRRVAADQWEVVRSPRQYDPAGELAALRDRFPRFASEVILHERTGPKLMEVMTGRQDPVQLLFPGGSSEMLERFYVEGYDFPALHELMRVAVGKAIENAPQRRALRVLEVGAGTGALTRAMLPALPLDQTEYLFTDVGPSLLAAAKSRFAEHTILEYQTFDLEREPQAQSIAVGGFDLIMATDVLHATRDLRETLRHLRACLAEGGMLIFLELISRRPAWNNIFGLLSGWWRYADTELRKDSALLQPAQWKKLLKESGFGEVESFSAAQNDTQIEQAVFVAAAAPSKTGTEGLEAAPEIRSGFVLFADEGGVAQELAAKLRRRSHAAWLVRFADGFEQLGPDSFEIAPGSTDDMRRLLEQAAATWPAIGGIVHCASLDHPRAAELTSESLRASQSSGVLNALRLAQVESALPSRIWFLTRNVNYVQVGDQVDGVASSPLVGLARVANNELAKCESILVDLDSTPVSEVTDDLLHEILNGDGEFEVAYRSGRRFAIRLERLPADEMPKRIQDAVRPDGSVVPYRLQTDKPGIFTNLSLNETRRREPGPTEIEVRVRAGGINFRDVMKALGTYPGNPIDVLWFGDDFSGVVERVGSEVKNYRVGDRVAGMAPYAFRAYATVDARMVFPVPHRVSFEQAATLPTVFLTAHYALNHLARMRKGEKVLIHAGTGGVGQAAIQIAKRLGLEIFATAGSDEKRKLLKEMGVHHVMSSRTLDFADKIREITQGRGVDAVLNSLAGDFIPKSFSVLAPFGRFLEIGKIDIYRNTKIGLEQLRNNISYFIIDLAQHLLHQPDFVAQMFGELAERFAAGDYQPLPKSVFPITQVVDAFRFMAQGKHIGKNVLSFDETHIPIGFCSEDQFLFHSDATYLVTGGAGGFGLALAQWMAQHGARHLALMSRSGPRDDDSRQIIQNLKDSGVTVLDARGDVTRAKDVNQVVEQIKQSMPPLRGVIHGAMVLDDEFLSALDEERFNKSLDPKMLGAWNLHTATLGTRLDHFICLSSFSTVIGGPRQSNYNAGNVFLESLVQYRHAQGLAAQASCWGALLGTGFVERNQKTAQYLDKVGMKAFRIEEALRAIKHLILRDPVRVAVCRADWRAFTKSSAIVAKSPTFAAVSQEKLDNEGGGNFTARLAATPAEARAGLIESFMINQVASVFGADSSKIDGDAPLTSLGLDSLMAIELTNRIERDLGASIPMGSLLNGPSIKDLAQIVLRILEPAIATDAGAGKVEAVATGQTPLEKVVPSKDGFGLSIGQNWTWQRMQIRPGSVGNEVFCARFERYFDAEILRRSFTIVTDRHAMLKALFEQSESGPIQRYHGDAIPDFEEHDLRTYRPEELRSAIAEHAERPFDVTRGPVSRLELLQTHQGHVLLLSAHPLIADTHSLIVIIHDLLNAYQVLRDGGVPELDPPDFSFEDFANWQRQQTAAGTKGSEYWKRYVDDAPTEVFTPVERLAASLNGQHVSSIGFTIDEQLSHRLLAVAAEHDVSLVSTLLGAFQALLHQTSQRDDFLIGVKLDGRQHREMNSVIGGFATSVPIRSKLGDETTFSEMLKRNEQELSSAVENQNYPLSEALHFAIPRSTETEPDLQVYFSMQGSPGGDEQGLAACTIGQGGHVLRFGNLVAEGVDLSWKHASGELELKLEEAGGVLRGCWRYDSARLEPTLVHQLHRQFLEYLTVLSHDPVQRVQQLTVEEVESSNYPTVQPVSRQPTRTYAKVSNNGDSIDFVAEAELDPTIKPPVGATFDSTRLDDVLLTGATGFLGAFLLDDLLRMTNARVHCLVRAANVESARERILDNLARYELTPPELSERLIPIVGDLAEERLGLSEEEFDRLADELDAIYHNGAIVNLVYPYSLLKDANVRGTEEVLRLAARNRLKPVHHVSTFWVLASDDGQHRPVVAEDDELPPCEGLPIGYSRSKWVGELMIHKARERGIPVTIYRPGYVTGDSRTGACNPEDFMHAIMLACTHVKAVPTLDMNLEITPVDFVSRAIVQLSLQPEHLNNTYHLVNPNPLSLEGLAAWMQRSGMNVRPVSYATWKARLTDLVQGSSDALIAPLMSLLGDGVNAGWHPRYDCSRATAHLAASGIECPPADDKLLAIYHTYLQRAGLLRDASTAKRSSARDAVTT